MYGPVATTCSLYVDGACSSNFDAYSLGTAAVTGITRNEAKPMPCALVSSKVILYGSLGSSLMPGTSWTAPGFAGAPLMKLKYVVYWFGTFFENARSNAYLTSLAWISRLTGGANLTPFLSSTVTVFLSPEIWGALSARSGRGFVSPGLNE